MPSLRRRPGAELPPEIPVLDQESRVIIVGGPKVGKTTLARELSERYSIPVFHTDDFAHLGWSECSAHVAGWFTGIAAPWIIEGVAVPRALRKWMDENVHRSVMPYTHAITLWTPRQPLTTSQERMAKGVRTVWEEVCRRSA